MQHRVDALLVELHRFAPQQVFRLDVAQALDVVVADAQFVRRRHREHRQSGHAGELESSPPLLRSRPRQRNDQMRRRAPHALVAHRFERPQHRHASDACALLCGVVVEQPQHDPALVVDACHQTLGGLPGAQDQRTPHFLVAARDLRPRMLVEHAVGHAHHAHAHQRHERMQRQHRARHAVQLQAHHDGRAGQAGAQAGPG